MPRNLIKWYQSLWPVDKHYVKNALIALTVLAITTIVLVVMFILTMTHDRFGDWPFLVEALAVAFGGLAVGVTYYGRALRGKK